jgi:hypothetical protein
MTDYDPVPFPHQFGPRQVGSGSQTPQPQRTSAELDAILRAQHERLQNAYAVEQERQREAGEQSAQAAQQELPQEAPMSPHGHGLDPSRAVAGITAFAQLIQVTDEYARRTGCSFDEAAGRVRRTAAMLTDHDILRALRAIAE